jgi:hypothetical protein
MYPNEWVFGMKIYRLATLKLCTYIFEITAEKPGLIHLRLFDRNVCSKMPSTNLDLINGAISSNKH